jgi:hypothetical protein
LLEDYMQRLWTWDGKYFGYRRRDDLFTASGQYVGRFRGDEVFDSSGMYIGEIHDSRLIRNRTKRGRMGPRAERVKGAVVPALPDTEARQPTGPFEGFPPADSFH